LKVIISIPIFIIFLPLALFGLFALACIGMLMTWSIDDFIK